MTTTAATATVESTFPSAQASPDTVEALVGRIFGAGIAAAELFTIHIGLELGLFQALADAGPIDSAALADRTGLAERYVREWLQAQTTSGLTTIDRTDLRVARFSLAPGVRDVLLDPVSPAHIGPVASALAAVGAVLPRLVEAFRTGGPVPYDEYPGGYSIQSAFNRPAFTNDLVATWIPAMPEIAARLADTARPARVGDLGCGAGWSSIALAQAYPHISVEGLDNDAPSIELARANAAAAGIGDRVTFSVSDLGVPDVDGDPRYDIIVLFECLHDFPRPVEALANARRWLRPGGAIVVMDERAAETLTESGDDVERFFAHISVLWCLPQGLVGPEPEPVGTLMRPASMRELAARAGFADVTVLDLEHPFWRFYRLNP